MSTQKKILEYLKGYADLAFGNMIKNYWYEGDDGNYFVDPGKEGMGGGSTLNDLMWNYSMGILAFDTLYNANKDERIKYYMQNQFYTWNTKFTREHLLSTGKNNNPAMDDAAWSSMTFLTQYKYFGDEYALDNCHDMIKNAYDYWQHGSTSNGLWYCYPKDREYRWIKSIYSVGLILAELEYYAITKGTDKEDAELHQRTLDLYNWIETHLGRNGTKKYNGVERDLCDHLYFCNFEDFSDTTGKYGPEGWDNPFNIKPAASHCALFGVMGMAVINKKLHDLTGEEKYLDRAVNTANALVNSKYNVAGTIMNDYDAWTNSAYMGYFVREVLPLEGIDCRLGHMFLKTAVAIMNNAYDEKNGYYGADWTGGSEWAVNGEFGVFSLFSENSNTVHVIFAAYYAMKNGLIEVTDDDLKMFSK